MFEIAFDKRGDLSLSTLLKMSDASWLKVLAFFGVWTVIWLPIAFVISKTIGWKPGETLTPQQKLILLGSLYILSPIILAWKIQSENLSFATLGLTFDPNLLKSLFIGLIVGIISLTIIFAFESILKLVSWHWGNKQELFAALLPILLLSLLISVVEEAIFRGYAFSTLLSEYSLLTAASISSLIFALLHLIWERKETLPQIPGLWLMGMILTAARLVDGDRLGLAIGLHTAWIWGLTCIDSAQLLTYRKNDSWLTGLHQQPLAGIAGISCLILTGIVLWLGYETHLLA